MFAFDRSAFTLVTTQPFQKTCQSNHKIKELIYIKRGIAVPVAFYIKLLESSSHAHGQQYQPFWLPFALVPLARM
jgi:hypothetical protein